MAVATVVVDSTCLIALERIERLELLKELFPEVIAPPGVVEEFGRAPGWLTVRKISKVSATALRVAQEMGLRPIGTVGVILRAKREGLTPECRPLLDSLMRGGFYLSPELYQEALRLVGET